MGGCERYLQDTDEKPGELMGAWGVEAFANDYALDDVDLLASKPGVLAALEKVLLMTDSDDPNDWSVFTAYGACEVIAAAHAPDPYFQSEGTTLFANLAGPDGPSEATPYVPEEISDWLAREQPSFSVAEIEQALEVIDILKRPEMIEDWSHPDSRLQALDLTRFRLEYARTATPAV
jgi:hypothetical protein